MKRHEMPVIPTDDPAQFIAWLKNRGVYVTAELTDPSTLHPLQEELSGERVGHYYDNPSSSPVWITYDRNIVDGHHRWGAAIVRNALSDYVTPCTCLMVSADVPTLTTLAHAFNQEFGIERKTV